MAELNIRKDDCELDFLKGRDLLKSHEVTSLIHL